MKGRYGFKVAPRGLLYLCESIGKSVDWKMQKLVKMPMVFWELCAYLLNFSLDGKQSDSWSKKLNNTNSVSIYLNQIYLHNKSRGDVFSDPCPLSKANR